jgi:ESCRT-II complex subunit VPS36
MVDERILLLNCLYCYRNGLGNKVQCHSGRSVPAHLIPLLLASVHSFLLLCEAFGWRESPLGVTHGRILFAGGVLRLVDTSKKQVDESLEEAFKDLRALMEKAQEMVALAERLRRSVANSSNDVPSSGSRDTWTHVMEDLTRLGIGSPVSRDLIESESRYYVELARQVYDFALKHIAKESAHLTTASSTTPVRMPVTLVDLYCLYNRARGTNLISPDDLLRACQLFVTLGLKDLKLEKLPSGVLALVPQQAATDSTMDITRLLATHITQHGPATALQVANALRLSIPLVTHYLLQAEAAELLCRDESMEGLIFWPNVFLKK